MTRRSLVQGIIFMTLFILVGGWAIVHSLLINWQDPSVWIFAVIFLAAPVFFWSVSVRRLIAINHGVRPEEQMPIRTIAGKGYEYANNPMIQGRELRWVPETYASFTLFDAQQQRQRGSFAYSSQFMKTPEAFFQIDDATYVVRWVNYFSKQRAVHIQDQASGRLLFELPMLSPYRLALTLPEGIFACDTLGGACLDATGAVAVQTRTIQDSPRPYMAIRVAEQYGNSPALPLLISICTYLNLRDLGRDHET